MKFVKIVPGSRSIILARKTEVDPWVEVESILGDKYAREFAQELEEDEEKRCEYIDDSE